MKYWVLISCMIFVGACSSVGNSGEEGLVPAAIQTEEAKTVFVPEPTLEGSWAGLPYDENWELRVVEVDEEREIDGLYAYFAGQEVLINKNIPGCELSYWFGIMPGFDEYRDSPEKHSYISYEKRINGREFDILLSHIYGKLDVIRYLSAFSEMQNYSNVYQNGYLGSFLLRLVDTGITPCIGETEWLLEELDSGGMYVMVKPFMEWNNVRRFGVP